MVGRRISQVEVRRRDLRVPVPEDFADRLVGREMTVLGRRGKYLVGEFDDDTVLLAHLGMSGRIVIEAPGGKSSVASRAHNLHEHIVFEVGNGTVIRFSDPRRFGLMVLTDRAGLPRHPLIRDLGLEPLGLRFLGLDLDKRLANRKSSIKSALLDQKLIAGIGNIYACEALHEARLSPRRKASSVRSLRAYRLAVAIQKVLESAIAAGGSSLRDHVSATGELGYFQHAFRVYGREGEPCFHCSKPVRRILQTGRSTFYCSTCQR